MAGLGYFLARDAFFFLLCRNVGDRGKTIGGLEAYTHRFAQFRWAREGGPQPLAF